MTKKNEVLNDYKMLDSMSKDLKAATKRLLGLGKKVASKKSVDMMSGLVESLDMATQHMTNAYKEVERAKKRLKDI